MRITKILSSLKDKIKKEIKVIKGEKSKNKIFQSKESFPSETEARKAFSRSKVKLFHINQWSDMSGISSTFKLYSSQGIKKEAAPEVGDYVLISLPGPLPENWVKITSIKNQDALAEIVVSPSDSPLVYNDQDEVTHFFTKEASSTFRVRRLKNEIFGYEIGKDETINNDKRKAGDREWINTLIAQGAWLGFQKIQWENFTDYLVHKSEID